MKIAIDARMYQESGVGRYIRNLIYNLQKFDSKNEYFILLLQRDYDTLWATSPRLVYHKQSLPILRKGNNFRKILANFRWYGISEQLKLPNILNRLKPDLIHFPHFNVPIFYRGKFIVTIHDLIHQHFQMRRATTLNPITYKIKQLAYKKVFKNAITKSVKILVPSSYVKNLLVNEWGISGDKIVVTPEAVDNKISTIVDKMSRERIDMVMRKFNIQTPYLFYVGNAHPHKNVEGLIKGFLKLKEKYPKLTLVLAGYDHYFWQRLQKENQHSRIIYTGYVSDGELVALYKQAKAFVMPSFEEGFGIPLLETMACSCPVVSSNAGALKEVGGDAAIYFDPHNLGDMGSKIDRVLKSNELRTELKRQGQKRVKQFSWEKLAKQTLKGYQECV